MLRIRYSNRQVKSYVEKLCDALEYMGVSKPEAQIMYEASNNVDGQWGIMEDFKVSFYDDSDEFVLSVRLNHTWFKVDYTEE